MNSHLVNQEHGSIVVQLKQNRCLTASDLSTAILVLQLYSFCKIVAISICHAKGVVLCTILDGALPLYPQETISSLLLEPEHLITTSTYRRENRSWWCFFSFFFKFVLCLFINLLKHLPVLYSTSKFRGADVAFENRGILGYKIFKCAVNFLTQDCFHWLHCW